MLKILLLHKAKPLCREIRSRIGLQMKNISYVVEVILENGV